LKNFEYVIFAMWAIIKQTICDETRNEYKFKGEVVGIEVSKKISSLSLPRSPSTDGRLKQSLEQHRLLRFAHNDTYKKRHYEIGTTQAI